MTPEGKVAEVALEDVESAPLAAVGAKDGGAKDDNFAGTAGRDGPAEDALASSASNNGTPTSEEYPPFAPRLLNIILCSCGWCLGIAAFFVQVTTTTLVAREMGGNGLSTIPLGSMLGAAALSNLPISALMQRFGKQPILISVGTLGIAGAGLLAAAVVYDQFPLLVVGAIVQGVAYTAAFQYRFLAVEFAHPEFRPNAISITVLGGVLSPVVGPEMARIARPLFSTYYAGSFMVLGIIYALQVLVACSMRMNLRISAGPPGPPSMKRLCQVLRSPDWAFPMAVMAPVFGTMGALMAVAPLAMLDNGLSENQSVLAVQAHILGMFAPSIFTGKLVQMFGAPMIMLLGAITMLGGNAVYFAPIHFAIYCAAITLVGVGWNFAYVAASTVVSTSYKASEAIAVQGITDLIVITCVACCVSTTGLAYKSLGWHSFLVVYLGINGAWTLVAVAYAIYKWKSAKAQTTNNS